MVADGARDETAESFCERKKEAGRDESSEILFSSFDPKLLDFLVCPLTKTRLTYCPATQELISPSAGVAYPIRDGIPVLLPDQARPLEEEKEAAEEASLDLEKASSGDKDPS